MRYRRKRGWGDKEGWRVSLVTGYKLEKSCSRALPDENRQLERHRKRNRRRNNKEAGKDKSIVINNRKRGRREPKTQRKNGRGQLLNSVAPLMLFSLGLVD